MNEYHKIQSVFLRDPATNNKTFIMPDQWAHPEFAYLANNEWVFTEKVDGQNIRIMLFPDSIRFGGRTEKAVLQKSLVDRFNDRFLGQFDRLQKMFPDGVCLYGEGYGNGIQKGGGNYRPDVDFALFDVLVCDYWLQRDAIENVAASLGIDIVPVIGRGTLHEMVAMTQQGFMSQWGNFLAEGIVARPAVELLTRSGKRIITKVKHKDFAKSNVTLQQKQESILA